MREIELKFQVDNFDKIKSILESNNEVLSEEYRQSDTIYVSDLSDTESKEGSLWLRVRKVNDKIEMNLKKQSAKKMESEEIEFEVSDYDLANQFLKTLG
ncbi:MAG: CYTH domain-containing protein, partial [Bacilli bacterium]|nr:CYTH domain-containing protein [Bacilli bacterium]